MRHPITSYERFTEMKNLTESLLDFISCSPSCFHAVDNIIGKLDDEGYTRLYEGENWSISKGGRYYTVRNLSSVVAFAVPGEMTAVKFMITASHSDSPTFKIKDTPELADGVYTRINTERYGGMIFDSWLDRPLSVAGRVMVRTQNGVEARLVNLDRDLLLIPHVAPHMENPNDGKKYNPASDLVPLYGDAASKDSFMKLVSGAAGVSEDEVISHELFLYNRQPASVWGAEGQFISSPKLDDLECAFASLAAITETTPKGAIPVMFVADNEEVGSLTKQGAASTFLRDVLSRICDSLGGDIRVAASQSMMLSADNAHAVHPNNPGLADPVHRPVMNGGVVMKYNASQLYTTDAVSAAVFREICRKADVPVQVFANRSDLRGGSTLGNISNGQVSMSSVDIGLAQLAMHSSYETAGAKDIAHMVNAMKRFFETELSVLDGEITIK